MQIRQLQVNEYDRALTLSLDVFIQCGKNDFDEEGLETFKSFIYNKDLVNFLILHHAYVSWKRYRQTIIRGRYPR